jgi:hypothetical protein
MPRVADASPTRSSPIFATITVSLPLTAISARCACNCAAPVIGSDRHDEEAVALLGKRIHQADELRRILGGRRRNTVCVSERSSGIAPAIAKFSHNESARGFTR